MKLYNNVVLLLFISAMNSFSMAMNLENSIQTAFKKDAWVQSSQALQNSLIAQGKASSHWQDPKIQLTLNNLPLDSFDIKQEGMTGVKFSISQKIANTDKLKLKKTQFDILASAELLNRKNRQKEIRLTVSKHWLNALLAQKKIQLINENYAWFEQMLELSEADYRLGYQSSGSQHVLAAQLEIMLLDDRLMQLQQQLDSDISLLFQYLEKNIEMIQQDWPTIKKQTYFTAAINDDITSILRKHPSVLVFDKHIDATQVKGEIAIEEAKMDWAVGASYTYRPDMQSGVNRSDLISITLSSELPIFSRKKRNDLLQSAKEKEINIAHKGVLRVNQLSSQYQNYFINWQKNEQRLKLYSTKLLDKTREQTQIAINAYTNNKGNFSSVVKSKIQQLDAELNHLSLLKNKHFLIAQHNYLLAKEF